MFYKYIILLFVLPVVSCTETGQQTVKVKSEFGASLNQHWREKTDGTVCADSSECVAGFLADWIQDTVAKYKGNANPTYAWTERTKCYCDTNVGKCIKDWSVLGVYLYYDFCFF